jgi:signal transduction histidine kinase
MKEEDVRLVLELSDTPPVVADESSLKFVFSSLIGNALDALLDRPVRTFLNLAVSNMIVSEYGGRIEVQSTERVGSTFRVVLPAHSRST